VPPSPQWWGESPTASLPFRVVSRLLLAVTMVVTAVASAGCGLRQGSEPRDGLKPDTARFAYGDRTVDIPLVACGRDGDVVVLGGTRGSVVLQAAADVSEGGTARTGVTLDLGAGEIWGAFGSDMPRSPAGTVREAKVEGDRLIVDATWAALDGDLAAVPGGQTIEGRLTARCPEADDNNVA
jgi:hypothetical protein